MSAQQDLPFMGHPSAMYLGQHQPQQQYYQPVAAATMWHAMQYQPLLVRHPAPSQYAPQQHMQYQGQQSMYAPSSSCPSLYSLQKPAAFPHTQHKLVPSQVAQQSQPQMYQQSQQKQVLQPAFFLQQSSQRDSARWATQQQLQWQQQQYYLSQQQQQQRQPLSELPLPSEICFDESNSFDYRFAPNKSEVESQRRLYAPEPEVDPLQDLKLIPASAANIPPHPSIEKSGVPFADFATDLVWEVCASAREQAIATSETRRYDAMFADPVTPGQYGSIGGERSAARRKKTFSSPVSLDELYFSGGTPTYLSSPESPAGPLTPPSSTMSTACPIPTQFQNGKAEFMQAPTSTAPWTRDHWDQGSPVDSPSASRPSPSFKRFVKDLLTLTLVTPQVLLLATLYVARMASNGETGVNKFLAKGMPYKTIMGSLICANKHLDDNSFRCCTWATVSCCPIEDVAQAEALVLKSLHFDLNVSPREWASWLQTLVERRARQNPAFEDHILAGLCALVDEVEESGF